MTKITDLNKVTLTALRPELDAALAALGEKYGLKIRTGNGSFMGASASFKVEIVVDDPEVQTAKAREEFNRYCGIYGLEPGDFGAEFTAGRKRYRLVGLALNRTKFPLKVEDMGDGNKPLLLSTVAVPAIVAVRKVAA